MRRRSVEREGDGEREREAQWGTEGIDPVLPLLPNPARPFSLPPPAMSRRHPSLPSGRADSLCSQTTADRATRWSEP